MDLCDVPHNARGLRNLRVASSGYRRRWLFRLGRFRTPRIAAYGLAYRHNRQCRPVPDPFERTLALTHPERQPRRLRSIQRRDIFCSFENPRERVVESSPVILTGPREVQCAYIDGDIHRRNRDGDRGDSKVLTNGEGGVKDEYEEGADYRDEGPEHRLPDHRCIPRNALMPRRVPQRVDIEIREPDTQETIDSTEQQGEDDGRLVYAVLLAAKLFFSRLQAEMEEG
mmetsp:Transcript_36674/g.70697  ORF Transcript_36674/g.70697 Transcript_36674/m.70697 type:complete len:227 (+) Transcript_36674:52-732(+)